GRTRVIASEVGARQGMEMLSMLREEGAGPRGRRSSETHVPANLRLPLSASPAMPEWIGKVLDRPPRHALKELAVLRHLPLDRLCRRLREIPVSCGVPPDRHQRMARQFAQLFFREGFPVRERPAVDLAFVKSLAHMQQHAGTTMNCGLNCSECAPLARKVSTFEFESKFGQFDPFLRTDQFGQAEPPGIDFACNHSRRNIDGER